MATKHACLGLQQGIKIDPASGRKRVWLGTEIDHLSSQHIEFLRAAVQAKLWLAAPKLSPRRAALLSRCRDLLCNRIAADRDRLAVLDRWLGDDQRALPRTGVARERALPAIPVLTMRDRVRTCDHSVYRMFESVEQAAARHRARAADIPFLLFHGGGYRQKRREVEVCVPIVAAAVEAIGGRVVAGVGRAACVAFTGSCDEGARVQVALERWMTLRGMRIAGPLRERYLRFGADQCGYSLPKRFLAGTPADCRTELQIPMATSDARA